ncbi:hypothetical protein XENOCAPTIV_022966 [Xenoophorus captivus]|uniref:Secreted protein n=1 Tax=Xenoophorus captivus TaxID=1517983 RepID=A0ABV0RTG6_9TELE
MNLQTLSIVLLVISYAQAFQYIKLVQYVDDHQEEYVEVHIFLPVIAHNPRAVCLLLAVAKCPLTLNLTSKQGCASTILHNDCRSYRFNLFELCLIKSACEFI